MNLKDIKKEIASLLNVEVVGSAEVRQVLNTELSNTDLSKSNWKLKATWEAALNVLRSCIYNRQGTGVNENLSSGCGVVTVVTVKETEQLTLADLPLDTKFNWGQEDYPNWTEDELDDEHFDTNSASCLSALLPETINFAEPIAVVLKSSKLGWNIYPDVQGQLNCKPTQYSANNFKGALSKAINWMDSMIEVTTKKYKGIKIEHYSNKQEAWFSFRLGFPTSVFILYNDDCITVKTEHSDTDHYSYTSALKQAIKELEAGNKTYKGIPSEYYLTESECWLSSMSLTKHKGESIRISPQNNNFKVVSVNNLNMEGNVLLTDTLKEAVGKFKEWVGVTTEMIVADTVTSKPNLLSPKIELLAKFIEYTFLMRCLTELACQFNQDNNLISCIDDYVLDTWFALSFLCFNQYCSIPLINWNTHQTLLLIHLEATNNTSRVA